MNSWASTVLARTAGGSIRSADFAPIKTAETPERRSRAFASFQRRFRVSSFSIRTIRELKSDCGEFMVYLLTNRTWASLVGPTQGKAASELGENQGRVGRPFSRSCRRR